MEKTIADAEMLISAWIQDHRIYLLDGDPRGLHPVARAALVKSIVEFVDARPIAVVETKPRRKKADGQG